ncbi:PDZ domain-containing protein [Pedobacter changchengzhani]|uniref:PDZ domain-containing protein n=1 Tax=Pedobacter changchengzhani TaxID=2529274 RepID=A0A4V3A0G3_9SPHI|nr:aspartyl protease family protein [Pedobacter changchengzhani]TDG37483.1 PDZ domain-containing protein [Pedobacter changchengzhani]
MLVGCKNVIILLLRQISIWVAIILFSSSTGNAQDFAFTGHKKKQSIHFKLIKNLIIIPVFINGKGPYDFILDTGVGPMIITDPTIIDTVDFNNMRKIKVMGLGGEDVQAYISQILSVKIGKASMDNIPAAILKKDLFNLSGYLGLKIYGLVGYSFFNSFIVDVRYSENVIKFYSEKAKVKFRGDKVPISIDNLKPYIETTIQLADGSEINAKFLIDTGASHALSLETLNDQAFPLPQKKIVSNLGLSLSGQISGYIARIKKLQLGKYSFDDVVAGFPNYASIANKIDNKRNGNVGAEILRRFNIQFNYRQGFMYIKPNIYFKTPFEHNMLGMVVYLDQETNSKIIVGEVDEDSPAQKQGLQVGDEIVKINFKSINDYTFNDIDLLFKSKENRTIVFQIYRDSEYLYKVVRLEKRI